MAKHEAELRMLKEKRQKKKQAQLASFNKQLQQQDNVKNSPQRDSKLPRDGPTWVVETDYTPPIVPLFCIVLRSFDLLSSLSRPTSSCLNQF